MSEIGRRFYENVLVILLIEEESDIYTILSSLVENRKMERTENVWISK